MQTPTCYNGQKHLLDKVGKYANLQNEGKLLKQHWGLQVLEGSTMIDLTGAHPAVLREGKGDSSMFV